MDIEPVKSDINLREVRLRAINIGTDPAIATFVDPKSPKLSPKFWLDDKKEVQYQVLWSKQMAPKEKWEQTFYVEGIESSDTLGDVVWEGDITPGKPAYPNYVSVYQVDLDVDSDNNGSIDGDAEDRIERSTDPMRPGKIIIGDVGKDSDSDGVPDSADGLGLPPTHGEGTSGPCGGGEIKLVPLRVELKEPIDLKTAKVVFSYGDLASIPRLADEGGDIVLLGDGVSGRSYHLNKTGLRIWAVDMPDRDGTNQVGKDVVEDGGKFIPPDIEIPWAKLAEANGESPNQRVLTLFLEYATGYPVGGLAQQVVKGKRLCSLFASDENCSGATDGLFVTLQPEGNVSSLVIDITGRKKGTPSAPETGLLLKTGDTFEFALAPQYFEVEDYFEKIITWQECQLMGDGTYTAWRQISPTATGTKFEHVAAAGGIFQIQATIASAGEQIFKRKMDAAHGFNSAGIYNETLRKGQPDFLGVSDTDVLIALRNHAMDYLGKDTYAKAAPLASVGYGVDPSLDFKNSNKCNIFVFHIGNSAGSMVPTRIWQEGHEPVPGHPPTYTDRSVPPAANDWYNSSYSIGSWVWLGSGVFPQPGFAAVHRHTRIAVSGAAHIGILDYDGTWINAGKNNVNKSIHVSDADYQPTNYRRPQ
jgi:hypothetical protein